jgi:hypothetical protein
LPSGNEFGAIHAGTHLDFEKGDRPKYAVLDRHGGVGDREPFTGQDRDDEVRDEAAGGVLSVDSCVHAERGCSGTGVVVVNRWTGGVAAGN